MSDTLTHNTSLLSRQTSAYPSSGETPVHYGDRLLDALQNRDVNVKRERIGALLTLAHRRNELKVLLAAADHLNRLDVVTEAAHIHAPDTLKQVLRWKQAAHDATLRDGVSEGETSLADAECGSNAVLLTPSERAGLTAPHVSYIPALPTSPSTTHDATHPYLTYSNAIGRDTTKRGRFSRRACYVAACLLLLAVASGWWLYARQGGH